MARSLFIDIGGWEMRSLKSYKAAAVFMIAAIVLLAVGYDVQRSANAEWKEKSGTILTARIECGKDAKARAWSHGGSSFEAERRLTEDAEACGNRMFADAETLHAAYEARMENASAILVFGILFFLIGIFTFFDVFFDSFIVKDRRADKTPREELVRMRVSSFQRRARLAKRENAMLRLGLARY